MTTNYRSLSIREYISLIDRRFDFFSCTCNLLWTSLPTRHLQNPSLSSPPMITLAACSPLQSDLPAGHPLLYPSFHNITPPPPPHTIFPENNDSFLLHIYKEGDPCSFDPSFSFYSLPLLSSPSPSPLPSYIHHPIFHQDCKHNGIMKFFFLASHAPPFVLNSCIPSSIFSSFPPCTYLSIYPPDFVLLFHTLLSKKYILLLLSYSP